MNVLSGVIACERNCWNEAMLISSRSLYGQELKHAIAATCERNIVELESRSNLIIARASGCERAIV